jgi:hypothetical protein
MKMQREQQIDYFELKTELYRAYYDCRRNKRNTSNALAFEICMEQEIETLFHEIVTMTYRPGHSVAFIVTRPVVREIFAAGFRDRVVHHYLINKLNVYFERLFIYDSYSCRTGKGNLFGIKRAEHFLRSCSRNYTKDCYVLKLDIRGFFMHINRQILLNQVIKIVERYYRRPDIEIVLYLCRQVILQNPSKNCIVKGGFDEWVKLPKSKSLFQMSEGYGLPIGNLTSQIFANVYLNDFDHYVKRDLQARYYGRYVDDFLLIDNSKQRLIAQREEIRIYLKTALNLDIHPQKEYFQHCSKGFAFLGAYIKPYRRYITKRVCKNFRTLLHEKQWINNLNLVTGAGSEKRIEQIISYSGLMKHYKTYNILRKDLWEKFPGMPKTHRCNDLNRL